MEQDLFSEIVELQFYKITLLKLNVHATRPQEAKLCKDQVATMQIPK